MLKQTGMRIVNVLKALGSLLGGGQGVNRDSGRVIVPRRDDAFHTYPAVGLTPSRALSFLQQADAGSPRAQFELFSEMLQKWPRLAAIENTRRLALTGLEWEIVPAQFASRGTQDAQDNAERAAEFCRETIGSLDRFRDVLDHLASAIGFGISIAELVWEDSRLIDIVPVPHSRIISDVNEPWRLRVLTDDQPSTGVALDEQPFKWIINRPSPQTGRQFEGGLLRASVLLYVAQNLSFKDWLIYSQIAGMPVRVAQFEPGTPESDKQGLLQMLERMGTDAVAVFSKNIELNFVESTRSASSTPYEALQSYCNTEITILWLGQHLTTDISGQGSRAAAEIHDRVREDLLVDDIADEGQAIRRDLLTPLVHARFGDGVPTPQFRRSLVESTDIKVLADTLAVAVNELGIAAPQRWAHRALGIPQPTDGEPVLSGRAS